MTQIKGQDESSHITIDGQGRRQFDCLSQTGLVEIVLPSLQGSPNPTERLHAKDFGAHVVGKVTNAFDRVKFPYLKSGPQQSPAEIYRHYLGAAEGSALLNTSTLKQMKSLAAEFEEAADQRNYFEKTLRPYLHNLAPRQRG